MRFSSILVVCEANVCRSPLAEHLLRTRTGLVLDSAGISARAGDPADIHYCELGQALGLDLERHSSKPVTRELLASNDLILVMTPGQKKRLSGRFPEFSGRIMLLGQWIGSGVSISDPHRKSEEAYRHVFDQIDRACSRWAEKL